MQWSTYSKDRLPDADLLSRGAGRVALPGHRYAEEGKGDQDEARGERDDQGYASGIAHQGERMEENALQTAADLSATPPAVMTSIPSNR